jgi:transglutaminase-like putative cysteine protease
VTVTLDPRADEATHQVGCRLDLRCLEPSTVALAVTVAESSTVARSETLSIQSDGREVEPVEVVDRFGTRTHVVSAGAGPLVVDYQATISAAAPPSSATIPGIDVDRLEFLRQSRYSPSDALTGFARATFGASGPDSATAHRVVEWVNGYLAYEAGSSGPLDTAAETLLFARGVCRDFAHLAVAVCRGLGIPARLVAVYAPGLAPMDFHAVVEAHTEHGWEVLDPSRLAPRSSLVRIATGRDAADTAFVTTVQGDVALDRAEVMAIVSGDLPADDHAGVVRLA